VDQKLNKMKMLKVRMDSAVALFHKIDASSEQDPDGEWDFGKKRLTQLRDLKHNLDKTSSCNDFWKEWSTAKNFGQSAKKKYSADDILKFHNTYGNVEDAVAALEKMLSKLQNMQKADNEVS